MGRYEAESPSTQTKHPWRTTVRSAFQFLVGLAGGWALIVGAAGIDPGIEWVGTSLAIASGITRVMALPVVDALIRTHIPWLATDKAV
jgi:hypothetical protein